jgi:hypothetical protein
MPCDNSQMASRPERHLHLEPRHPSKPTGCRDSQPMLTLHTGRLPFCGLWSHSGRATKFSDSCVASYATR